MKVPFVKKKLVKFIANVCFLSLGYQLIFPAVSFALTSGPSQPEMQSFEPVGTTDMVNMFSGDFNYNIPLLDVEGYPVNIYYHAGPTVEQEASWVGLGWNINPGNINHIVRGFSDDYNGDVIEKKLKIEDESNKYFNLFFGVEAAGVPLDKIFGAAAKALKNSKVTAGGQLNFGMNFNNYSGVSASVGVGGSVNVKRDDTKKENKQATKDNTPWISGGLNMGATVSTDKGVDVDYSFTARSLLSKAVAADVTAGAGGKMNSREGMKYNYWGVNPSFSKSEGMGSLEQTYIPTGLQNYVPVVTNATTMNSTFFHLKVGVEGWSIYPFGGGGYGQNVVKVEEIGHKKAYGYFNMANASTNDIMDFAREKDGNINRSTKFLPPASLTYDIYSINGHGTGGSFRPYRNDIGTVHDPELGSHNNDDSHLAEAGIGNTFELGYDYKTASTQTNSGPWKIHNEKFTKKTKGSLYEPYYLKQAGELTPRNETYYTALLNKDPLGYIFAQGVSKKLLPSNNEKRVTRANLLYFLSAEEASRRHISLLPKLENYNSDGFKDKKNWELYEASTNPNGKVVLLDRVDANAKRRANQASEFTQVLPDGQRYIFGLPVMNLYQKDYEVSVAASTNSDEFNEEHYEASFSGYTAGLPNSIAPAFSSGTVMPSFAHAYMLTSVLSTDYVDITGNGITEDDLGSYTKFNYRQRENYKWRVPYGKHTAQRNRGLRSDCKDDKASFSGGEREQWMLHSIESRNFVAEFYTSAKKDGNGADASEATLFNNSGSSNSYKLDSIVLFNKWDRFENEEDAERIQTVVFYYDYSLCKNVPNKSNDVDGKLTLKSIFIKKGNSKIGYLSPYQFKYNTTANEDYNMAAKDCWGNYKPKDGNLKDGNQDNNISLNNLDYPYVNQKDPDIDEYSKAWNLEEIIMPSGGKIKVTYESDDYGYVQDKKAMEMFRVEGVGPTTKFTANNTLYQSAQNPYLYVYFKRKTSAEHGTDIASSYLGEDNIIQFNFDVLMSPGYAASCNNTPLTEAVKGYARVIESGICDNSSYGYLKLEPRTATTAPQLESIGIQGAKINPVSLAAINLARFRAPKILNPEMDIPSGTGKALVSAFKASLGDFASFFQNALKTYLNKGKAQTFTIGKSYVRLVSQGLKKKGGGHRVKKLEFVDNWEGSSQESKYGSVYDYTVPLPGTNKKMSSGVASYEPLYGGDENPCRTLMVVNEIGNRSKFPAADPIELQQEHPIGETMYPPASVGYSKITVTSIHKDVGESSQTIQEFEHYTAKDFPVKIIKSIPIETLEDRKPQFYEIFNKQEIYRIAQGYALELNDMHGKLKQTTTWVAKYDPANLNANPDSRELVTYTKYNYFQNVDNSLSNNIPCLQLGPQGTLPEPVIKTLGEEVEITLDSRQKEEKTSFKDFHFSTNGFLAPPIPIVIPIGFPKFKKQSKTFSSFVNTKIIQKYGVVKSIQTYDKGALTTAENYAFDPNTGQALITNVNTEYGDKEYTIKYPAYWAYKCMGSAYENILFEDELETFDAQANVGSRIRDDIAYLRVKDINKYNIGDEIELTLDDLCANTNQAEGKKYKVWVVDKGNWKPNSWSCSTQGPTCIADANNPIKYRGFFRGTETINNTWTDGDCLPDAQALRNIIKEVTNESEVDDINATIEVCDIFYRQEYAGGRHWEEFNHVPGCKAQLSYQGLYHHAPYAQQSPSPWGHRQFTFNSVIDPIAFSGPIPHAARYRTHITLFANYKVQKQTTINGTFFDLNSPLEGIAEINLYVWSDNKPANMFNTCGYYNKVNGSTTYFNYDIDQTPSSIPACSSGHLALRGGVYTTVGIANTTDMWAKPYLIVKPYKRDAVPTDITSTNQFPENDDIIKGSIKVVRSGKRNQLTESVQQAVTNVSPYINNPTLPHFHNKLGFAKMINASAHTYTDIGLVPDNINSDYFNEFVTGKKGNYRVLTTFVPRSKRDYPDGGNYNQSDRYKGIISDGPLWGFNNSTTYSDEYYNRMYIPRGAYWREMNTYIYSAWGKPISVIDALRHNSLILYDFDNRVPAASVANAHQNGAIYESFEDANELHKYDQNPIRAFMNPLKYYPNPLKAWIRSQVDPTFSGIYGELLTNGTSHSGNHALKFLQNTNITLDLNPAMYGLNMLDRFYLYSAKKYVVSCWQKTSSNGTPPPVASGVEIKWGSSISEKAVLKPKTPPIDGWVLYEAIFTIPGTYSSATITAAANTIIDDFRLLPAESNMKAFVYDPLYRRIAATLDENHMTTFFEYDSQGKLIRIKKETEKGILTVKESRESLKEIISSYTY